MSDVTLEKIAEMVANGFSEVHRDIQEVRSSVDELRTSMDDQFKEVNSRLDLIQDSKLLSHQEQIDQLRDKVIRLEMKLAK